MKRKNKNGFTLLELLLVITLVVSLLGIAIINVTKLTKKQKENSFESVKKQVITAAEQYFESNQYLFDAIEIGGYGIISVESLVNMDYLNKLTNPVTGEALNKCDKVKITRNENGNFDYEFLESNHNNCNYVVAEIHNDPKAPDVDAYFVKGDNMDKPIPSIDQNGDNWYNNEELDGSPLNVIIKTTGRIFKGICKGNCPITATFKNIDVKTAEGYGYKDDITYLNDQQISKYTYKVCNGHSDKSCTLAIIEGGKDIKLPTCSSSIDKTPNASGWFNNTTGIPVLTFEGNDETSGIKGNKTVKPTIVSANKTYSNEFIDNAGNKNSCSKTVKYNNVNPPCTLQSSGEVKRIKNGSDYEYLSTPKSVTNASDWYTSNVNIQFSSSLNNVTKYGISNSNSVSYNTKKKITHTDDISSKTYYGFVENEAGNTSKCSITIKKDSVPPTLSKIEQKFLSTTPEKVKEKDGKYTYVYYKHKIRVSDNLSGLPSWYHYNHCYDRATAKQNYLQCGDFNTGGKNGSTIKYGQGYAKKYYGSEKLQSYTFPGGVEEYYHLFYKLTDVAGNVSYYRYNLVYSPKNGTSKTNFIGKE